MYKQSVMVILLFSMQLIIGGTRSYGAILSSKVIAIHGFNCALQVEGKLIGIKAGKQGNSQKVVKQGRSPILADILVNI